MLDKVFDLWDVLLQLTSMFLILRYIFFERPLEARKQKIYYIVSYALIVVSLLAIGYDVACSLILVAIGLNVFLARKEHKILGALLSFPVSGIAAGLFLPIVNMPGHLFRLEGQSKLQYAFFSYSLVTIVLVIGLINKKRIDKLLSVDWEKRTLRNWERTLLVVIGLVLAAAVGLFEIPDMNPLDDPETYYEAMSASIFVLGVVCFIMTVMVIITIAAGNKQSYYKDRVNDMQFNIIVMMADLVENRDANTGGHIKRTAKYVEIIAKKLKSMGKFTEELTDEYIADIIVAAPLHDIGKIHISDLVLNKNGKLSDEEFDIMKSHTSEGRKILEHAKDQLGDFSYLDVAVQMAGSHHEWWDGSKRGYPLGTSYNEIPLSARIMAVADVFDALTSRRVYKEPMPPEKAYSIIKEEVGTHFDPDVIEAFFAAKKDIDSALEKFLAE